LNKNSQSRPNKALRKNSKTSQGHNLGHFPAISPELVTLVKVWNTLPEHIRKQIIELAGLSGHKK
jgi:hypothetical protein